jgi:hypothetical protein
MLRCFVIQPFDKGPFDQRYEDVLSPAINNADLEPYRVDQDPAVSIPIQSIEDGIQSSYVCLADITLDNPNVWFEVGYAIAAKKEVVFICSEDRRTPFPFDVQHRTITKYATASPRDFKELQEKITRRLKAIQKSNQGPGVVSKLSPGQTPQDREPKPNIRCLGPLTARLRMGMDGHGFYEDAESRFGGSLPAAIVCFRNEASTARQVQVVYNARASVAFMDDSGQEMGLGIAETCWLGELRNINFPLEQTQCAIVAILLPDGTITCPYVHHTQAHWGEALLTEMQRFDAHPKTIEVRLVEENDLLLEPCVFDFSIVEGRPVLKQRPTHSR